MITIKLILWLIVIAAFVYADYYQIKKKHSRPFYLLENILKGAAFICYGSLIWQTQYEPFTVVLFLWCVTTYWLLFDIALGIALHSDPLYVGRTSGWIDRFHYLNNWTMLAYWIAKFIALITAVCTTLYIYKHAA
jgi:hypothetical protein